MIPCNRSSSPAPPESFTSRINSAGSTAAVNSQEKTMPTATVEPKPCIAGEELRLRAAKPIAVVSAARLTGRILCRRLKRIAASAGIPRPSPCR